MLSYGIDCLFCTYVCPSTQKHTYGHVNEVRNMILITGWLLKPLPLVGRGAKLIKHNTKTQDYYQPLALVNATLSANTLIPVNHIHVSRH